MATERLTSLLSHLAGSAGTDAGKAVANVTSKNPDDVVITMAVRTPLTKGGKGGLKDTPLDHLLYSIFKASIEKSKIDPVLVEDICVGNVLNGNAAYYARAASLAAGFPVSTALSVCNRFCSSGLLATQTIANQIREGSIDIGLAVGAESMSQDGARETPDFSESLHSNQDAIDCLQPMLQTSENVGVEFNVTREEQDEFAAMSYNRAEASQKSGAFDEEIIPVETYFEDPKTNERKKVVISKDDGIRYGTTKEALGKVRPAAPQWGKGLTTGGNASQVTDGAAAVLLMKRSTAQKLGQAILAKFVGATVVALEPRIMGIAIPKILAKTGLTIDDVELFEINEAFASMAVYCTNKLQLDRSKVNVRGGAIAIGHPLGATGARQIVTGLAEMRKRKSRILVTSMCVGTGQGMASVIVNEVL